METDSRGPVVPLVTNKAQLEGLHSFPLPNKSWDWSERVACLYCGNSANQLSYITLSYLTGMLADIADIAQQS